MNKIGESTQLKYTGVYFGRVSRYGVLKTVAQSTRAGHTVVYLVVYIGSESSFPIHELGARSCTWSCTLNQNFLPVHGRVSSRVVDVRMLISSTRAGIQSCTR